MPKKRENFASTTKLMSSGLYRCLQEYEKFFSLIPIRQTGHTALSVGPGVSVSVLEIESYPSLLEHTSVKG